MSWWESKATRCNPFCRFSLLINSFSFQGVSCTFFFLRYQFHCFLVTFVYFTRNYVSTMPRGMILKFFFNSFFLTPCHWLIHIRRSYDPLFDNFFFSHVGLLMILNRLRDVKLRVFVNYFVILIVPRLFIYFFFFGIIHKQNRPFLSLSLHLFCHFVIIVVFSWFRAISLKWNGVTISRYFYKKDSFWIFRIQKKYLLLNWLTLRQVILGPVLWLFYLFYISCGMLRFLG